ncbi:MAG: Mrp/NBP35 family ATP-binding protein [Desulfobacteraceae bacterium]|nr:Mrp/NBP35 family ATP-binding protein [Desulfobacteraceae bacterium]MCF8095984.1 Mrp/NBP35 family ATP-binding protein [Desulfobacteraceae bacterium]
MTDCQQGGCSGQNTQQNQQQEEQQKSLQETLSRIRHKFLVMSGKGGVGKTSVSVNLAMALAEKGYKVGIMDVDVHGPDVPRMLGLTGLLTGDGNKLLPMRYSDNLSAISIEGLMPDKDSAVIWRGPLKHSAITQFVADVEWGALDFLIVDSPPGTGDEPMSVAQTVEGSQAIIVTTPQEVALSDVRKSINFCNKVEMPVFGLIENMSGYKCPHCSEIIDLFGTGGGEKTAEQFGLTFLGRIPFDPNLVKAGDSGQSYMKAYADTPATQAFDRIVEHMAELVNA